MELKDVLFDIHNTFMKFMKMQYGSPQKILISSPIQGLSQDFHNRVSKLGFQELKLYKIPD